MFTVVTTVTVTTGLLMMSRTRIEGPTFLTPSALTLGVAGLVTLGSLVTANRDLRQSHHPSTRKGGREAPAVEMTDRHGAAASPGPR